MKYYYIFQKLNLLCLILIVFGSSILLGCSNSKTVLKLTPKEQQQQINIALDQDPQQLIKFPTKRSNINNLANKIHTEHKTFYCGCCYKDKVVDLRSCGYKVQKNLKRAMRSEWEHIVPVSVLAKRLPCWQKRLCCNTKVCYRGRACCAKIDPYFIRMVTDLHNIVPELGELNAIRSNYGFAELPHISQGRFGKCEFKLDKQQKKVEAKDSLKGIIARVYLYMYDRYKFELSKQELHMFKAWHRKYPPTKWELAWNNKIYNLQGTNNNYISKDQN